MDEISKVDLLKEALEKMGFKYGVTYFEEFKFSAKDEFQFDLAIPSLKIAIEYEGSIFTSGRHTRGKGYHRDCEKYNLPYI